MSKLDMLTPNASSKYTDTYFEHTLCWRRTDQNDTVSLQSSGKISIKGCKKEIQVESREAEYPILLVHSYVYTVQLTSSQSDHTAGHNPL